MINFTFRPINWTGPRTPWHERRSRWTFKASWSDTLKLLDRELRLLDAERVVIEADFREQDIRIDGMIRANARQPEFPGIRIAFDSKHGPLIYQTDEHELWQHNVRAIALSLEALRSVDRYGVTKHAEQYTGWRAIGSGTATPMPAGPMTHADAEKFVWEHAGPGSFASLRAGYRAAARRLHPDVGGDAELFKQLQEARRVLGGDL